MYFTKFFFFFLSSVVKLRKVWKHTPLISKLEKNKAISLGFPEWRKARPDGQAQYTPRNHQELTHRPSPPQPQSFPIKTNGRAEGKGRERKKVPNAGMCSNSFYVMAQLCILQRWHHWGKISQESASPASVFVLSKSALIYLQHYLDRHARTDAPGCTPSFTDVETGNLTVRRGLIGKLCSC